MWQQSGRRFFVHREGLTAAALDYGTKTIMATMMKASEFKARCLQLMDQVARGGEPIVMNLHDDLTRPLEIAWEAADADP